MKPFKSKFWKLLSLLTGGFQLILFASSTTMANQQSASAHSKITLIIHHRFSINRLINLNFQTNLKNKQGSVIIKEELFLLPLKAGTSYSVEISPLLRNRAESKIGIYKSHQNQGRAPCEVYWQDRVGLKEKAILLEETNKKYFFTVPNISNTSKTVGKLQVWKKKGFTSEENSCQGSFIIRIQEEIR